MDEEDRKQLVAFTGGAAAFAAHAFAAKQPGPIIAGTPECGGCTLCCKVMAVTELEKPRNVWCDSCNKGRGCGRYDSRPEGCRNFECLWLQSQRKEPGNVMPPSVRPDRSKVVLTSTASGEGIVAHVDPGYPRAAEEGDVGKFLLSMVRRKVPVIIAVGEQRRFYQGGTLAYEGREGGPVPFAD